MLDRLLTEQRNPASAQIDALPVEEALRIINAEDRKVAEAVGREIPKIAEAVEAIVAQLERGGRLFYIGAGTSGRLGVLDAAECPPTFSVPPELVQGIIAGGEQALARATEASEDDPELGVRDLEARGFTGARRAGRHRRQRTYAIRAGRGRATPGSWARLPSASVARPIRSSRAPWISPIAPETGPEVIAGSTRMKAGHRHEARAQHAQHGGDDPAGTRLRQPDGERAAEEREAARPRRAHHCGGRGRGSRARRGVLDGSDGTVKVAILMARLGIAARGCGAAGSRGTGAVSREALQHG